MIYTTNRPYLVHSNLPCLSRKLPAIHQAQCKQLGKGRNAKSLSSGTHGSQNDRFGCETCSATCVVWSLPRPAVWWLTLKPNIKTFSLYLEDCSQKRHKQFRFYYNFCLAHIVKFRASAWETIKSLFNLSSKSRSQQCNGKLSGPI